MDIRKQITNLFRWDPKSNPPPQLGSTYFFPVGMSSSTFDEVNNLKAFMEVPEVNAIVTTKARMFSKMTLEAVSKQTSMPYNNYPNLVKVLRNPNYFQAQKEYLRQTKIFRETFGNEFIYMQRPFGMSMLSVKNMFTLPPYLVDTKTPDDRPFYLYDSPEIIYMFKWGNYEYDIPQEFIIHLNENRVKMDKDNWVRGESWLSANRAPVNNIRAAYEARGTLIENRGALGILSDRTTDVAGAAPIKPKEKEDLQNEYKAKYGLRRDQWNLIISNKNLQWVQMAVDPDKLGLYTEVQEDFYKLCDAAGVDLDLFANSKGATFENKKQAEKKTYEGTIIPEAQEWIDAMNAAFETEDKSWHIVGTFDLQVFQENWEQRGRAISLITNGLSRAYLDQAISLQEYQAELAKMKIGQDGNN